MNAKTVDTGLASRGELIEEIDRLRACEEHTSQHMQRQIDLALANQAAALRVLRDLGKRLQQHGAENGHWIVLAVRQACNHLNAPQVVREWNPEEAA